MEHAGRDRFKDLRLLAYVCNAMTVDQPMNLTYHCEFGKLVYLSASSLHITSASSVITELKHFFALAHVLIRTSCKCDRSSFRKKRHACPRPGSDYLRSGPDDLTISFTYPTRTDRAENLETKMPLKSRRGPRVRIRFRKRKERD